MSSNTQVPISDDQDVSITPKINNGLKQVERPSQSPKTITYLINWEAQICQTRQNSCIQCGIYSVQLSHSGGHSVSGGSPCHMLSGGRTSLCLRPTAHPGEEYPAYSWEHSPIRAMQCNSVEQSFSEIEGLRIALV